jgi:hypothetical protein
MRMNRAKADSRLERSYSSSGILRRMNPFAAFPPPRSRLPILGLVFFHLAPALALTVL